MSRDRVGAEPIPADLEDELAALLAERPDLAPLADHLTSRLVGYFGDDHFEVYVGKDGLKRHSAAEVAAVALVKLAAVLAELPEGSIQRLTAEGRVGNSLSQPGQTWRHGAVPTHIVDPGQD